MPIEPVGRTSPASELDLDLGKEESRQKEQPKPRSPGKAAVVELSEEARKNAALDKEWDNVRGNIKVNQALSKQKSKDLDAKQDSLFRDETRDNPNRAEMERRAVRDQDARTAEKAEKARTKAAENEEYKDKRTPKSDLIRQAELEKMKEILNKPKTSGSGGGSGGMGTGKMNRDITKNYKKGGKVSSASSRADGCAIRGKTRA